MTTSLTNGDIPPYLSICANFRLNVLLTNQILILYDFLLGRVGFRPLCETKMDASSNDETANYSSVNLYIFD